MKKQNEWMNVTVQVEEVTVNLIKLAFIHL